ncbi:MAG: 3'-5' exonuclease [Gemmatimonadaceae bacterium]
MTSHGIQAHAEPSLLIDRAARYLAIGPADAVDLIGHVCNLPRAPRIVAEHMAVALLAGRRDFERDLMGRWLLSESTVVYSPRVAPAPPVTAVGWRKRGAPTPEPLAGLSYVVVDVETTGGSPPHDRITEFAAVVVRDGEIREVFETLVNPERSIPTFVTRLTNISWEMVRDAPKFADIAPRVREALEGNVFVAHNAQFDWKFVCSEMNRASGKSLIGRRLCTVKLARKLLPQLHRRSLDFVANYYGVEIRRRHRAGGDALATAHCLLRLLNDATERGCDTWHELDLLLGVRSARKRRRPSALPTSVTRDTTA